MLTRYAFRNYVKYSRMRMNYVFTYRYKTTKRPRDRVLNAPLSLAPRGAGGPVEGWRPVCGDPVFFSRRVAAPNGPNTKEIVTTVTPHSPSISGLPHDLPSSVARQQRKKPDPRPPQAAGALKIALLAAHGEHVPRRAPEELDHSTLLLRPLSVLCAYHAQAIPRPYRGIEEHL